MYVCVCFECSATKKKKSTEGQNSEKNEVLKECCTFFSVLINLFFSQSYGISMHIVQQSA